MPPKERRRLPEHPTYGDGATGAAGIYNTPSDCRLCCCCECDRDGPNFHAAANYLLVETSLQVYNPINEYSELARQFAYVTMFSIGTCGV